MHGGHRLDKGGPVAKTWIWGGTGWRIRAEFFSNRTDDQGGGAAIFHLKLKSRPGGGGFFHLNNSRPGEGGGGNFGSYIKIKSIYSNYFKSPAPKLEQTWWGHSPIYSTRGGPRRNFWKLQGRATDFKRGGTAPPCPTLATGLGGPQGGAQDTIFGSCKGGPPTLNGGARPPRAPRWLRAWFYNNNCYKFHCW